MRIQAAIGGGWAEVELRRQNGYLMVAMLRGSGSVRALYLLGRDLQELAAREAVYFPLACTMPRTKVQRRILERLGGRPVLETWALGQAEGYS